ncbi:11491_t:CDS:2 [Ambispora gerdemannii]|uniref:11491_t:CDS:1 n=1 Tax=Ambispora gerdemannii TaxID=144530 RepID=A0A9N8ZQG2_9GLOM|nr:11491_t:CDS:2 [Ambispora gerdemannii]
MGVCMGACSSNHKYDSYGVRRLQSRLRFRYQILDGRRYQNLDNSVYWLPVDDIEAERSLNNHLFHKRIWNGNFHAPITERLRAGGRDVRVLDIGCGPGAWILEMAKFFPNVKFIGIDVSTTFSTENIPPNVRFIECNILDGLPIADASMDFVFQRFITHGLNEIQFKEQIIPEMIRVMKPGGWIEFTEGDCYQSKDGIVTKRLAAGIRKFLKFRGINGLIARELPGICRKTGQFGQVFYDSRTIRLGLQGGEIGEIALRIIYEGMKGGRIPIAAYLNIMPEHYDALTETMLIEAEKGETTWDIHKCYAQKKLDDA